jgi:hypothetical protein
MKQLRQPSQLVAANISTTAGTELPTLTTAMLDEKSIREIVSGHRASFA